MLQNVGESSVAVALCFEITETAAVTNLSNAIYFMRELLLFIFTKLLVKVRSKTLLSLLFSLTAAAPAPSSRVTRRWSRIFALPRKRAVFLPSSWRPSPSPRLGSA